MIDAERLGSVTYGQCLLLRKNIYLQTRLVSAFKVGLGLQKQPSNIAFQGRSYSVKKSLANQHSLLHGHRLFSPLHK